MATPRKAKKKVVADSATETPSPTVAKQVQEGSAEMISLTKDDLFKLFKAWNEETGGNRQYKEKAPPRERQVVTTVFQITKDEDATFEPLEFDSMVDVHDYFIACQQQGRTGTYFVDTLESVKIS